MLTEETKSTHFGTLKFDDLPTAVPTFFHIFSKTAKKAWYLAVKCEKANKRIRFLSVKTLKMHLFGDENSWPTSDCFSCYLLLS